MRGGVGGATWRQPRGDSWAHAPRRAGHPFLGASPCSVSGLAGRAGFGWPSPQLAARPRLPTQQLRLHAASATSSHRPDAEKCRLSTVNDIIAEISSNYNAFRKGTTSKASPSGPRKQPVSRHHCCHGQGGEGKAREEGEPPAATRSQNGHWSALPQPRLSASLSPTLVRGHAPLACCSARRHHRRVRGRASLPLSR
jgi:hypothetical protein